MEDKLEQEKKLDQEKNTKNKILKITSYVVLFGAGFTAGIFTPSSNTTPEPNDKSVESKPNIDLSNKDIADIQEEKVEEKKQEPCPVDITSIGAGENSIGSSEVKVTYKNNGKDAVKNLEFYICAWDTNGYPIKLNFGYDSFVRCQADQPNTLPGKSDSFIWTTYSAGDSKVGKYKAVISKVEFYDGTEWTNDSAEQEISELSSTTNK